MSFETTERFAAFNPSLFANLPELIAQFGSVAQDGPEQFATLLAFYDNSDHTRIRAAWYDPNNPQDNTIKPIPLTDGRVAVWGLWSEALVAAWQNGAIQAEELTAEQIEALRVKDNE